MSRGRGAQKVAVTRTASYSLSPLCLCYEGSPKKVFSVLLLVGLNVDGGDGG